VARIGCQLPALEVDLGALGVALAGNRHVFADRHGERAGDDRCHTRHHEDLVVRGGARYAHHHARRGNNAVVGPHDTGAQPVQPVRELPALGLLGGRDDVSLRCSAAT
jgi:hypothetical protein